MENLQQKAAFLKTGLAGALTQLDAEAPRKWGKMNVLQMIEHMSDSVRISNGRKPIEVITPAEKIVLMQAFLESEKPMRENTPNVLLPDEPLPARHAAKEAAIKELQEEIYYLFTVYEKDPETRIANPFFGYLSLDQQIQLLHKHATHHLRQFGVDY